MTKKKKKKKKNGDNHNYNRLDVLIEKIAKKSIDVSIKSIVILNLALQQRLNTRCFFKDCKRKPEGLQVLLLLYFVFLVTDNYKKKTFRKNYLNILFTIF